MGTPPWIRWGFVGAQLTTSLHICEELPVLPGSLGAEEPRCGLPLASFSQGEKISFLFSNTTYETFSHTRRLGHFVYWTVCEHTHAQASFCFKAR